MECVRSVSSAVFFHSSNLVWFYTCLFIMCLLMYLFCVFCRKKAQLKKKRGVPTINEQMLFHGTSNEFVEAICIHNFDWRINGMHAAVYGKGKYCCHIQQW